MKKLIAIIMSISFILCGPSDILGITTDYYDYDKVFVEENLKYDVIEVYDSNTGNLILNIPINVRYVTTTAKVNLRVAPTTESSIVATIAEGTILVELGRSWTGWSVFWLNDSAYFICSDYLTFISDKNVEATTSIKTKLINATDAYKEDWEYIGYCRISSYCYKCNSPHNSYKSSMSSMPCEVNYTCAANGIPLGTHVYIEGYGEFIINDRGPKAMNGGKWFDLFVDCCDCDIWCKQDVWIMTDY